MNLQQLRYILEVAKTGSMNKAAQNLFISQPNLSSSISNLEKELDIVIFNRTNKGVEITQDGKLLLRYSQSILGQVDQLKSIYSIDNTNQLSTIEISQSKNIYLTKAISNIYNTSNSTIKFTLNIASVYDVIKDVFNMKSEIGIIALSNVQQSILNKMLEQKKIEFVSIGKSDVCIIVGENSCIDSNNEISINDISNLTYIGYLEEDSSPIKYSVELSEIWSGTFYNSINVNDLELLRNLLHSVNSYSFDLVCNKNYLDSKGIRCINLKEKIEVSIGFIKRKNIPLSVESQLLIDEVKDLYAYK